MSSELRLILELVLSSLLKLTGFGFVGSPRISLTAWELELSEGCLLRWLSGSGWVSNCPEQRASSSSAVGSCKESTALLMAKEGELCFFSLWIQRKLYRGGGERGGGEVDRLCAIITSVGRFQ